MRREGWGVEGGGAYLEEKGKGQAGGEGVIAYHLLHESWAALLGVVCADAAVKGLGEGGGGGGRGCGN